MHVYAHARIHTHTYTQVRKDTCTHTHSHKVPLDCEGEEAVDEILEGDALPWPCSACRRCKRRRLI